MMAVPAVEHHLDCRKARFSVRLLFLPSVYERA
jgi:hypothetical protein